jgi:hypothetical protein
MDNDRKDSTWKLLNDNSEEIHQYYEMMKAISMNEEYLYSCLDLPSLQGVGS